MISLEIEGSGAFNYGLFDNTINTYVIDYYDILEYDLYSFNHLENKKNFMIDIEFTDGTFLSTDIFNYPYFYSLNPNFETDFMYKNKINMKIPLRKYEGKTIKNVFINFNTNLNQDYKFYIDNIKIKNENGDLIIYQNDGTLISTLYENSFDSFNIQNQKITPVKFYMNSIQGLQEFELFNVEDLSNSFIK